MGEVELRERSGGGEGTVRGGECGKEETRRGELGVDVMEVGKEGGELMIEEERT